MKKHENDATKYVDSSVPQSHGVLVFSIPTSNPRLCQSKSLATLLRNL